MFRKKDKDPTTIIFDDDEWIRSLTEAQKIAADILEDRLTHDQCEADPRKVHPIQMGEFLREHVSRRLQALSEGEIAASTAVMRQLGAGSQGVAVALAMSGRQAESKWMKKCFGLIE